MRKGTASKIRIAYHAWRAATSAHPRRDSNRADGEIVQAFKVELDQLVDQAVREDTVERAFDLAGLRFAYQGPYERWPGSLDTAAETEDLDGNHPH